MGIINKMAMQSKIFEFVNEHTSNILWEIHIIKNKLMLKIFALSQSFLHVYVYLHAYTHKRTHM